MAWRCQVEPYLKSISSKVTKCESASYKLKNKKVQGFNVHIEETVFFPEGGGQPGDAGIIKADDNITTNVLYTYRKGPDAIHFCDSEIEVGKSVELEIDWSRRFDHMQQHTGQHLISAIFDQNNNATTSWNMGEEINFVELDHPITQAEMQAAEDKCNSLIRECKNVSVELLKDKSQLRAGCKELPDDFAGPIRVVNHMFTCSHVQAIKLLSCEKGKKGRGLVWFVCGNRVFNLLQQSYTTQKTSCAKLSCQADQLPDRIDKLSLNLRGATKTIKNLWREIALNDAAQLKKSDEKLLKIHRKEAENDYLITFVNELKDQVDAGKVVFGCVGEKGGNISILGPPAVLDKVGPDVLKILGGKGNSKNGRVQGKVESYKSLDDAYSLIQKELSEN